MKVYPRIELDIAITDLWWGLMNSFQSSTREQLTTQIQSYWDTSKEILITLSVRTSFDLLLQALQLPVGSEIIMSAMNIGHMEEIVRQHHCVPVVVDIDLDTLAPSAANLETAISSQSRIFVIAHLFGAIAPIEPYVEICQRHHILLVEDCAQAFDGLRYIGHPDADINLFSFGAIKSCTALGGSVTLVKDRCLAQKIMAIEKTYTEKSEFWFVQRLLKYLCLKVLSHPIAFGFLIASLNIFQIDVNKFISSLTRGFKQGDIQQQVRYRPPRAMLSLLQYRLEHLNTAHYQRREQVAKSFLALLNNSDTLSIDFANHTFRHSYWLVAVLTENREIIMERLRRSGFDSTTGTTSLKSLDENAKFATKLINSVLYLPVYASMPERELMDLAQLIRDR